MAVTPCIPSMPVHQLVVSKLARIVLTLNESLCFSLCVIQDGVVTAHICNCAIVNSQNTWLDLWIYSIELPVHQLYLINKRRTYLILSDIYPSNLAGSAPIALPPNWNMLADFMS